MRGRINLIALTILLTLGACFPAPEPLIIDRPACVIPELREREPLPGVTWLPEGKCGEGDRCLNESQYVKLKELVATLRSYEGYLISSYNQARERCRE